MLAEVKILPPESLSDFHSSGNSVSCLWLKSGFSRKKWLIHIWGWLEIIFGGNKLQ